MRRSDRQRAYRAKMLRKAKHNHARLQWLYAWEAMRKNPRMSTVSKQPYLFIAHWVLWDRKNKTDYYAIPLKQRLILWKEPYP